MFKHAFIITATIALAGCSTSVDAMRDPDPPRLAPSVVQYRPGMTIPKEKPYIDSRGYVNSMYEPIVHCHNLHHPGRPVQKVCRIIQ